MLSVAPTITAPSKVTVSENATFAFSGANAISVADSSGTAESITLSVTNGTLTSGMTSGTGLSGTGPLAGVNSFLASLTYTPFVGTSGTDTLNISDEDTADNLTGNASVAITIPNPITEFALPTGDSFINGVPGIVAGPDGNIWFTDLVPNPNNTSEIIGTLDDITPAGAIANPAVAILATGGAEDGTTQALASNSNGNLLFTYSTPVPVAGEQTGNLGTFTPATSIVDSGLQSVSDTDLPGIAAGPNGTIWFTEPDNAEIEELTPVNGGGYDLTSYTDTASNAFPDSIVLGPDGNLWFTDEGGGSIGRITPAAPSRTSLSRPAPFLVASRWAPTAISGSRRMTATSAALIPMAATRQSRIPSHSSPPRATGSPLTASPRARTAICGSRSGTAPSTVSRPRGRTRKFRLPSCHSTLSDSPPASLRARIPLSGSQTLATTPSAK